MQQLKKYLFHCFYYEIAQLISVKCDATAPKPAQAHATKS